MPKIVSALILVGWYAAFYGAVGPFIGGLVYLAVVLPGHSLQQVASEAPFLILTVLAAYIPGLLPAAVTGALAATLSRLDRIARIIGSALIGAGASALAWSFYASSIRIVAWSQGVLSGPVTPTLLAQGALAGAFCAWMIDVVEQSVPRGLRGRSPT